MSTHQVIAKGNKGLAAVAHGLYSQTLTILLVLTVGMLVACGGSGGSSPTSESVVAKGVITGLGSIWVNGIEYETPVGGSYSDDDSTSDTASYQVGQVVSLRGTRSSNGVSGTATEVDYEAEIEGVASSDNIINGVTILITRNTNVTTTLAVEGSLDIGFRYEVSGFWLDDKNLEATYIKDDDDGDVVDEVKGFVEAPTTATTLTVRGVTYTYSGTPAVSVGDFVEIHFDPTTLVASEVELEDDFFDNQGDGLEVEIEGAVILDPIDLMGCPDGADFLIDATCIDWGSVESWEDGLNDEFDMVSGLRVEAEGHFNADGLLIAEKIKGRGNRVRITAIASNVVSGAFDVFGGAIQVTTQSGLTSIEDPLANGSGFEIRGIRMGASSVLAVRIKDKTVTPNEHELRAEVDLNGADALTDTITVMGISSQVDLDTKLKDEDIIFAPGDGFSPTPMEIDSFLNSIDDDDIVNATNGPRDVVEVQIDITFGDGNAATPYTANEVEIEREDD